jgi:translation elongation factor EF-G
MSVLQIALTPRTVGDMQRLAPAFAKLSREDMTLSFSINEATGRVALRRWASANRHRGRAAET